MNIDQAIEQLQECKRQWADRVVVCSSDRHLWWNLLEIELSEAYWKEKPGDAVINGDFTNPFTYEEYVAMKNLLSVASEWVSLEDEPLLNVLTTKVQWWVNHYEEQAEEVEE